MVGRRLYKRAGHRRPARLGTPAAKQPGLTGQCSLLSRVTWLLTAAVAAALVAVACAPETRHRVLVFLYDGVPPLYCEDADAEVELAEGPPAEAEEVTPRQRTKAGKTYYNHPPYWENRCGGCHDIRGGRLLKTAREGLCQSCHPEKPAKKKYVHGPVAVNGCLACHRYHKSEHPKLLIVDAQTLCFNCHEAEQMVRDKHHATMDKDRCVDCHDSHGGDDRYFLLPGVVTGDSS